MTAKNSESSAGKATKYLHLPKMNSGRLGNPISQAAPVHVSTGHGGELISLLKAKHQVQLVRN